ncbi:unnamed protein product [Pedinophyceae sp. YPF-701]|nr:unnamed protein product [Pedinophyceae sp. YPF-701]
MLPAVLLLLFGTESVSDAALACAGIGLLTALVFGSQPRGSTSPRTSEDITDSLREDHRGRVGESETEQRPNTHSEVQLGDARDSAAMTSVPREPSSTKISAWVEGEMRRLYDAAAMQRLDITALKAECSELQAKVQAHREHCAALVRRATAAGKRTDPFFCVPSIRAQRAVASRSVSSSSSDEVDELQIVVAELQRVRLEKATLSATNDALNKENSGLKDLLSYAMSQMQEDAADHDAALVDQAFVAAASFDCDYDSSSGDVPPAPLHSIDEASREVFGSGWTRDIRHLGRPSNAYTLPTYAWPRSHPLRDLEERPSPPKLTQPHRLSRASLSLRAPAAGTRPAQPASTTPVCCGPHSFLSTGGHERSATTESLCLRDVSNIMPTDSSGPETNSLRPSLTVEDVVQQLETAAPASARAASPDASQHGSRGVPRSRSQSTGEDSPRTPKLVGPLRRARAPYSGSPSSRFPSLDRAQSLDVMSVEEWLMQVSPQMTERRDHKGAGAASAGSDGDPAAGRAADAHSVTPAPAPQPVASATPPTAHVAPAPGGRSKAPPSRLPRLGRPDRSGSEARTVAATRSEAAPAVGKPQGLLEPLSGNSSESQLSEGPDVPLEW